MNDSKIFMLPENGYGSNNSGFLGGWGGGILGFILDSSVSWANLGPQA